MAVQEAISLAEQEVEAFNKSDWDLLGRLYGERGVYDERSTGQRFEGAEQIRAAFQGWKDAFPDSRGTITNAFSSGDHVTQEITWEGTQDGELPTPQGSIPASGRRVTVYAVQVVECEDGQIKQTRHYFDMLQLLQQIGAMD